MAKRYRTIVKESWHAAIGNHALAEAAWAVVANKPDCPARDAIGAALGNAVDNIYNFPAPNPSGTAKKLELFWGLDHHAPESQYSSDKRKAVGDIRRLERESAGLEEPDVSGRSTEQVEADLASWRAAVVEHQCWVGLLNEGPSEKWGSRRAEDLVSLRASAKTALLSLPASSLFGVILKVELLFETLADRECPAAGSILADLRRFAMNAELAWRPAGAADPERRRPGTGRLRR